MSTSRVTEKFKVMTIVGTRPELIRLSRIIAKLDEYCEHLLVHTGQNYDHELSQVFFDDLGIRPPDFFLDCGGGDSAQTIANVIAKTDVVLANTIPEAVLILGDTNSAMAAISAKRKKIPVFHMEAGNRCFDLRVPEEINRKIVDHVSDINMPYSDIARDYLLKEGIPAQFIIKTGSPMREVLTFYESKIRNSNVLTSLNLIIEKYFVVSLHREENVDSQDNLKRCVSLLNWLCETHQYPIVFSVHPRTRKKIEAFNLVFHPLVNLQKPLCFSDYIWLQMNAKAVLSDSGTITEESSILNFPAVNLRDVHERPEGAEQGSVILTGMSIDRVAQALSLLESQSRGVHRMINIVDDYQTLNVSEKVIRILLSYTDYVNRDIWKISH